jgi:hypothetical protein
MPQIVVLGRHNAVELRLACRPWQYGIERKREIDRHWQQARALNPAYFNGVVHLLSAGGNGRGVFRGELLRSDFKSFMHWRAVGHPDRSVRAAGVGAVLWSSDGAVLLGTAARGTTNTGRTYLFNGILDDHDIDAKGEADVVAGADREMLEETGLGGGDFEAASPWIWSTEDGVWINFIAERRALLPAVALRRRILDHNARLHASELADVAIIRTPADLERRDIFDNTRQLVHRLLCERGH